MTQLLATLQHARSFFLNTKQNPSLVCLLKLVQWAQLNVLPQ